MTFSVIIVGLIIQLNYHQHFVTISSRWTEKWKKYTPPPPLSAVGTHCHRIALGMIHTCTGGQRLITPSIRLSVEFFVFFTPLGFVSVPLTGCDPRLNTLSSSTSGVYLRTSETSISPGSEVGETSINPLPFQKPHGEICQFFFLNNFHQGKYSQIMAWIVTFALKARKRLRLGLVHYLHNNPKEKSVKFCWISTKELLWYYSWTCNPQVMSHTNLRITLHSIINNATVRCCYIYDFFYLFISYTYTGRYNSAYAGLHGGLLKILYNPS